GGADWPTEVGAGCATGAATGGGEAEAAATRVAGATGSFDGTLVGVSRSIDLEVWTAREAVSKSACAPCEMGFAKMSTNATTAANVPPGEIRPTNAEVPSPSRCGGGGGSGTGSGHEEKSDPGRRSCAVLGIGAVGAEGTYGLSVVDGCVGSRNRLGAYLL